MLLSSQAATRTSWRNKLVGEVLVLLSLAGTGLPKGWAQMQFNGAYVQTHREPSTPTLSRKGHQDKSHSTSANEPLSPSPDNDFFYSTSRPATASTALWYDNSGRPSLRTASSPSGKLTDGISAAVLPWNEPGFKGYSEPAQPARDTSFFPARKYSLKVTALSQKPLASRPAAVLVFHLPAHAMLWVEGRRIPLQGQTSYYRSPPLSPGKQYDYTVRVAWLEDGRWVSLRREVTVAAGQVQTVYLQPSPVYRGQK